MSRASVDGHVRSEAGLRDWLRRWVGEEMVNWIEPGMGGTDGNEDARVPVRGQLVSLELKFQSVVDGQWTVELRPVQWAFCRWMEDVGCEVRYLVASREDGFTYLGSSRTVNLLRAGRKDRAPVDKVTLGDPKQVLLWPDGYGRNLWQPQGKVLRKDHGYFTEALTLGARSAG